MRRLTFALFSALLLTCAFTVSANAAGEQLIGARHPALSPDGTHIAFSYMGDIWVVSSEGGRAHRLTNHAAYDREPVWSPDGRWIAFSSNRMGNDDIYIIPSEGGDPRQLTFHTSADNAADFSPDGAWIYFTSGRRSRTSVFKISVDGGNALPVLDTYWSWPYDPRISPDGKSFIFSLGMENGSKWRKGYRGSNSAKIWLREFGRNDAELLVSDESNSFWPAWSPDGSRIYFVSDRQNGTSNIWSAARDGSGQKNVTRFRENDIRWFRAARNVPKAVYERDFGIWITDLDSGESHAVRIDSPSETKDDNTFIVENETVSEFAVSPDGKKIAAVVRGEIFVLSTDGGYARNVSNSPWRERDVAWDKESRNIVFVSDMGANPDLYIVSALGDTEPVRLTNTDEDILDPGFSPDGKWIAYYQGKRSIHIVKPDGSGNRLVVEDDFGGRSAGPFAWSPDSRYIAVVSQATGNSDIYAVDIETGEKTALTNTAYDENSPVWSPDGKTLFFSSNRFGHSFPEFSGKWDIYRVFLEPEIPEFDEDEFELLFAGERDEGKKDKTEQVSINLNLEDIDRQTERVANTLGDERSAIIAPNDPKTVYFVSNMDGKRHLWKIGHKNGEWGNFEPFMPQIQNPAGLEFDTEGTYLYYISRGKIGKINIKTKKNESISFSTKIDVDKTADYEQMLGELYYILQHYYYDENHHNADWKKIYEQFRPVLRQVREDRDFYDYANEMIGHLNSSHTGMRPRSPIPVEKPSAHLGALWDFTGNSVTIEKIVNKGPLYAHRDSVAEGDELVEINGAPVNSSENIWKLLNGQMGRRVQALIKSSAKGRNVLVPLKPISNGNERNLIRDEWIESRREIVKNMTSDRAAYIYMQAMGRGDLEKFLVELERDAVPRDGLILDLRCNFGGNVHDRVLNALTKPKYAAWRKRGLSETPQSTFGFSDKPIVLLVNEVTLSDGEMTANGFKALKRGTIVGNTTYGWLIFTTSNRLMNGGYFRLPYWGCYTLDGRDLETMGGVTPDIVVINDLNHDLRNEDPQLEKAIGELLKMMR